MERKAALVSGNCYNAGIHLFPPSGSAPQDQGKTISQQTSQSIN